MHKHLKRVIHPNRYFIWALIYIILTGIGLVVFIYVSSVNLQSDSAFSDIKSKRTYIDKKLGFSVKYPGAWVLDHDPSGNIVFENPKDNSETITVTVGSLDLERVIRHSVDVRQETDFQMPGYHVAIIKAGSAKDGSLFDLAIITTDEKLYYISGHSLEFIGFVNNFKPL